MSPLHNQAVAFSGIYDIGCDAETGSVNEVLEEARKDLEKMKEVERRAKRKRYYWIIFENFHILWTLAQLCNGLEFLDASMCIIVRVMAKKTKK